MKKYSYKGYTFRRTTTVHANTGRYLYEIDDLKECGRRPFLTTIRECKAYIEMEAKR